MASRSLLFLITALGLAACADQEHSEAPSAPAPATAAPAPTNTVTPAAAASAIRECNLPANDPGTTLGYLTDDYKTVKLGLAVVESQLGSSVWAGGTPVVKASAPGTLTKEGDDLQDLDAFIGHRGQLATNRPFGMGYDSASDIFLHLSAPAPQRIAHTYASVARTDLFELDPAQRVSETPNGDSTFVGALQGTRVFAYTFSITTQNDCASGALADALGKTATVTDVMKPENRDAMQKLLARDGAALSLDVHATRYNRAIADVVFNSNCRVDNLAGCQETIDKLTTFAKTMPAVPTYDVLVANKDPNWAITDYTTKDTSSLGN
jgi:hypothetical protein